MTPEDRTVQVDLMRSSLVPADGRLVKGQSPRPPLFAPRNSDAEITAREDMTQAFVRTKHHLRLLDAMVTGTPVRVTGPGLAFTGTLDEMYVSVWNRGCLRARVCDTGGRVFHVDPMTQVEVVSP